MLKCSGASLTPADDNEFSGQLLRLVWMQFMKHRLADKLQQVGADPEGVAQDAAMHLRKKSRKGLLLRAEGWKPMMTVMNTAVYRFALTEILRAKRCYERQTSATDYYSDNTEMDEDASMEKNVGPGESRSVSGLKSAINDAEDMVIGDIVCSRADQRRIERLFQVVRDQILEHQTPLPHANLPQGLRRVPRELHGLVVARMLRAIRDFAAVC